jgi:transposase-like protein
MNAGTSTPVVETEVTEKAKRRGFTGEYKKKILAEADRCTEPGAVGALLRREGLYSSHLTTWRRALRERGELHGLEPRKRGPKTQPRDPRDERILALERRAEKLQAELDRANTVIEIQKKVSELLGVALPKSNEEK